MSASWGRKKNQQEWNEFNPPGKEELRVNFESQGSCWHRHTQSDCEEEARCGMGHKWCGCLQDRSPAHLFPSLLVALIWPTGVDPQQPCQHGLSTFGPYRMVPSGYLTKMDPKFLLEESGKIKMILSSSIWTVTKKPCSGSVIMFSARWMEAKKRKKKKYHVIQWSINTS